MQTVFRSLLPVAILSFAAFLPVGFANTMTSEAGRMDESNHQAMSPCQGRQTTSQPANIPRLIKALKSKDKKARDDAVAELTRIGSDAIPALVEFLNSEKGDARVYAAKALAGIDPKNKLAHSTLIEIITQSKGDVLLEAAETLAEIDPDNDIAVPALIKLAEKTIIFPTEKSLMSQRRAAMALALTGPGIRALTGLLKHWDSWVRRSVAFAFDERTETLEKASPLVLSAVKDAIPTLVEALKDKDETVRGVAGEVLEQIGAEAIPSLTEASKSTDKKLSSAATEVLEQIKRGKN